MAKNKKTHKGRRGKGQIMGRSDIPYAQRIKIQQKSDIAVCREHSAKIAMFCASVALHELEGIGYKRLVKFSLHFKEIVDEFYEDVDLGMAHAKRRMEQMGMEISGEWYTVKQEGLSAREQEVHDHSMQAVQIALICNAIAMNDFFGFGHDRQVRVSERVSELTERYAKEGEKFLLDEMRKIGFEISGNNVLAYMDEEGQAVTPRQWAKGGKG